MQRFTLCFILAVSFIFASCSGGNFLNYKEVAEQYNLPKTVEQSSYPEADGVLLVSTTEIDMSFSGNSVVTKETVHKVKKLFKNIENYAFVQIPIYYFEELESISARTIKTDGTVIILKSEEFYESSGESEGSTFYSDIKYIKFTFPSIEKNCIIEYEYTKLKLFPFMTDVWYIHNKLPTLLNTYTLHIPKILVYPEVSGGAGWDWNFKVYNYFIDKPVVGDKSFKHDLRNEKVNYSWTIKDIIPFKEEIMMPPADNYFGYVKFAPSDWKRWDDISEWYYKKMFEPQLTINSDIQSLANKLAFGTDDKKEIIRKIYDYVKDLRYVAIELGSGGLRPSTPADVLKRQYGDCKDKSILLISLLKAAGIEGKPVLVLTSNEGELDPAFPNWNFNHMIVKASVSNKEHYWLDATGKYTPLGRLTSFCENINVLVLNPDYTSKIEKTPSNKPEDNLKDISLTLDLDENGSAEFDACIKYYGNSNSSMRYRLEDNTEKEMKEFCKSLIADEFSNAEIKSCDISEIDSSKSIFCLKFKGITGNILQKHGDLILVSSDPFKFFENTSWLIKDEREYPIQFDYAFTMNKNITIKLPKGYSVRNLPEKIDKVSDDFMYVKNITMKDNAIALSERFTLKNTSISPRRYNKTKILFETIKTKYGEKIILSKN